MFAKFFQKVVNHPWLVLFLVATATGVFGFGLSKIEMSSAADTFFISNDPEKAFYEEAKRLFGHDGVTVIAMVSPVGESVFGPERMARLREVTDKIEAIDGVRKVVSLTNVKRIYGSGMSINVKSLIEKIPNSPSEWELLKNAISENPMYERNLISKDRRTAAINVFMDDFDNDQSRYYEIIDRISALLAAQTGPEKFYMSGIAVTSSETNKSMIRDLKMFMPLSALLIILTLYLSFRSFWGVFIPLLNVGIRAVWTLGFMSFAGIPISMITVLLPPLIVAIGNAYSIHVISEYLAEYDEQEARSEILISSLKKVYLPLIICGATTIIGFGSLGLNRIPSIRDLGLSSSVGVLFAVVLSLTVIPACLALAGGMKGKEIAEDDQDESSGLIDDFLRSLARFDLEHRAGIIAGAMVVSLVCVLYAFKMNVETDFLSFFKDDSPVTIANKVQQNQLAGAAPFFVVLDGKAPDAFKDPRLLRRLDMFETWLTEELPGIDMTVSIDSYIKLLNKVFHKNDDAFYRLPDSRKGVAQLLLFYSMSGDPDDFAPYVTGDFSKANVMVRSRIVGSNETERAIEEVETYGKKLFGDLASVKVTGTIRMVNNSANEVAWGQVKGIAVCIVTIFLIMSLLFLSPRIGFIAMVPNIIPVVALFGLMGYLGVTLNFSTSLIACIAIGLGVDDTIHFLHRYNDELKSTVSREKAATDTLVTLGKPVIFTSASLFFGFAIIAGSDFVPIEQFGFLTGVSILFCLAADLVLLPALVTTVRIGTLWDYVDLKLSRQGFKKIGIFDGLSADQAKLATLMGVFGFYADGETIVKKGESFEDLFVVLEGEVAGTNGGPEPAECISEGGQFGCIPGVERKISEFTYRALTPTKLLIVNQMALDRLENTHPKVAMQIKNNLDKLELTVSG